MDRFLILQTGELYLHLPIRVCGGLPPHLAARILEAPRHTLERIAQVASREDIDLVLFSGNMIDCCQASPADLEVFATVCEILAKNEIPVVWLRGEAEDQGPWPGELPLPNSVHVFSGQEVEQRQVATRKGPVQVLGCPAPCPWDTDRKALLPHKPGQLVIGLSRGRGVEELPHVIGVNYWVISGRYRKTETLEQAIIHSAGPPLTRDFASEILPTVTLIECDALRRTSLREVSVGSIRHAVLTLLLAANTQWAGLSSQLVQEAESRRASSDADWLIQIKLQGPADILVRWKRERVEEQLLHFVRSRYMQEPPYVWPTEIIWDPLDFGPEEWLKEKSYRGEFFRELDKIYQAVLEKDVDPEVRELLVESNQDDMENGPQSWEELIRQVAFQGLDLLTDLAS